MIVRSAYMNPPTGARIIRDNGALVLDWDPSFGLASVLEVRVTNAKNRVVRGARATLRGVGVRGRKRTSKKGVARFEVRPKARGTLKVRADKRGFRPGSASVTVR